MYCLKCKYTSFDNLNKCPKCGQDWTATKKKINLEWIGYSETPWLEVSEGDLGSGSAKKNSNNIISGFNVDEDLDFEFADSGADEDFEEIVNDPSPPTENAEEENIIDYFGEEGNEAGPTLDLGLDEFENQSEQTLDEDGEEIDISQLEWEEDELDQGTEQAASGPSGEEEADIADLQDVELEGIEVPTTEQQGTRSGQKREESPEQGVEEAAGSDDSGDNDLLADLSIEDLDEEILEQASADSGQSGKESAGDKKPPEMEGDIDYPELDLSEDK
ncbi:MAG: hypothetical protein ACLFSY_06785 [Desulfonatronovibrionaceae bacterium]